MPLDSIRIVLPQFLGLFSQVKSPSTDPHKKDQDELSNLPLIDKTNTLKKDDSFDISSCKAKAVSLMLEKGIPGMTICVSRRGEVVWSHALGFCDVENLTQCDPDASMRIASISKPLFAATVVGPMLQNGQIDLNSSVHGHLSEKEFPKQKYQGKEYDITIEQLLSHTSGIRHYPRRPGQEPLKPIGSSSSKKVYQDEDQFNQTGFFQRKRYRSVIEALEPFKNDPLVACPGESFKYTTYGYTLLSAVIQKVIHAKETSDDKKEQVEDHWMKTLKKDWKLESTQLDYDEPIIPKRARYYFRSAYKGGLINAPYSDSSVKWAGGGLISTTRDLTRFGQTMIDCYKNRAGSPLSSNTVRMLWTERKSNYGLGFELKKIKDIGDSTKISLAWHGGCAAGASSVLMIYPENEIVVAILTNIDSINLEPLGRSIAETFGA